MDGCQRVGRPVYQDSPHSLVWRSTHIEMTSLLQACYKLVDNLGWQPGNQLVTRLSQGCHKVVTRLLQGCQYPGYDTASRLFEVVTSLLQGCHKVVTNKVVSTLDIIGF